jgi:hypothetical protein
MFLKVGHGYDMTPQNSASVNWSPSNPVQSPGCSLLNSDACETSSFSKMSSEVVNMIRAASAELDDIDVGYWAVTPYDNVNAGSCMGSCSTDANVVCP